MITAPLTERKRRGRPKGLGRPHLVRDGVTHFYCRPCQTWKPEDGFYRLPNPVSVCHRQSECKKCSNARKQRSRLRARAAAAGGA